MTIPARLGVMILHRRLHLCLRRWLHQQPRVVFRIRLIIPDLKSKCPQSVSTKIAQRYRRDRNLRRCQLLDHHQRRRRRRLRYRLIHHGNIL